MGGVAYIKKDDFEGLRSAASAVMESWDRGVGDRERIDVHELIGEYWAPRASMVESEAIAALREALSRIEGE